MEFAIVDIETTGGYAAQGGITEIAIFISDGKRVLQTFQTLVNPERPIPRYIQGLTGITDNMVKDMPPFDHFAREVYDLLSGRVFVAHNVNFDYSFLKHHLSHAGYTIDLKKCCTVRLSRKIFPGFSSYSLGRLCNSLNVSLEQHHRAFDDARATTEIFHLLVENDVENFMGFALKKKSKEQNLPPHVAIENFEQLPVKAGVYYFKDQVGKVLYVGKAVNIKKRVASHFTGNSTTKQRQSFLRGIYSIDYQVCASELNALIYEAIEIKRLWPPFNRAIKKQEPKFALYQYENQNGVARLVVGKHNKSIMAIQVFHDLNYSRFVLNELVKKFALCQCEISISDYNLTSCDCYLNFSTTQEYNDNVYKAVRYLKSEMPSFVIRQNGVDENSHTYIVVEKGNFVALGSVEKSKKIDESIEGLKDLLPLYPSSNYITQLVFEYAKKHPEEVMYY